MKSTSPSSLYSMKANLTDSYSAICEQRLTWYEVNFDCSLGLLTYEVDASEGGDLRPPAFGHELKKKRIMKMWKTKTAQVYGILTKYSVELIFILAKLTLQNWALFSPAFGLLSPPVAGGPHAMTSARQRPRRTQRLSEIRDMSSFAVSADSKN